MSYVDGFHRSTLSGNLVLQSQPPFSTTITEITIRLLVRHSTIAINIKPGVNKDD